MLKTTEPNVIIEVKRPSFALPSIRMPRVALPRIPNLEYVLLQVNQLWTNSLQLLCCIGMLVAAFK